MALNISLVQVLDDHFDGKVQDMHVAIPGTVVSWDSTKQTATVQPMVRKPLTSADNVLCFETPPQIPNVPVMCMRGGGFFVSVPLNAGDGVLLVFSEQSYSEWRSTGQISSPKDVRRHGTGYPYAIPGISPDSQALGSVASNKLVIGRDGNEELITIGAGELTLGVTAVDNLVLNQAMQALALAQNTYDTAVTAWVAAQTAALVGSGGVFAVYAASMVTPNATLAAAGATLSGAFAGLAAALPTTLVKAK